MVSSLWDVIRVQDQVRAGCQPASHGCGDELLSCRGTATNSETALAEMIVIFRQTGLLEQCRAHMHGLGILVQVPLSFPERRFWVTSTLYRLYMLMFLHGGS
jgi:hypothetical protein